ncbi:unnamed protein product [Fraxinus pennsylvanica]|uniref:Uncharacterized protein n=1 Tax=Fraxinus pennsylvanica TaxID=56036 RepID=A0AAD2AI49_9LAMI|nr:unnamed protein product [Fraxinus pennsylvanica]
MTLGFQHYVLALGTTVMIPSLLVPLMGTDGRFYENTRSEECDPPLKNKLDNNNSQLGNIRQPSQPPVLPRVNPVLLPMSPSIVADPGPGASKLSQAIEDDRKVFEIGTRD